MSPCLFDGPINGERFRAYVEQLLVPTLKPGDVAILDNLGSHKGKAHTTSDPKTSGRASCFSPNTPQDAQSDRAGLRQRSRLCWKGRSPNIRRLSPTQASAILAQYIAPAPRPSTSPTGSSSRECVALLVHDPSARDTCGSSPEAVQFWQSTVHASPPCRPRDGLKKPTCASGTRAFGAGTPGPLPFSAMNSTPAASNAERILPTLLRRASCPNSKRFTVLTPTLLLAAKSAVSPPKRQPCHPA